MKRLSFPVVLGAALLLLSMCTPPSGGGGPGPAGDAGTDAGADGGSGGDGGAIDAGTDAGTRGDGGTAADAGMDAGSTATDGGPPIVAPAGQWTWIPVEGSQCASGSTAGIGINISADSDDLFLFLQGGGACWNTGTCVPSLIQYGPLCDYGTWCLLNAAGGQLPTASHVTERDPFPRDGGGDFPGELAQVSSSLAFDRAAPDNPFRAATFVYVPYCTGDLHAGNTTRTYQYKYGLFDQPSNYTVHFAGATNMDRYLGRLAATFPNVHRIWLTGSSAGGYGATLNFERVQRAFPRAEVHLLADSSPFIQPAAHWPEWRDTWAMQLPQACADCDAGFPQVMEYLAAAYPSRRMGLLSYDQDHTISWFFLAGSGLQSFLDPPVGPFGAALGQLEQRYDAHPNTRYFVVGGPDHVLLPGYGVVSADGGVSNPLPSRDGGTTLREWMNRWAEGDPAWSSTK